LSPTKWVVVSPFKEGDHWMDTDSYWGMPLSAIKPMPISCSMKYTKRQAMAPSYPVMSGCDERIERSSPGLEEGVWDWLKRLPTEFHC